MEYKVASEREEEYNLISYFFTKVNYQTNNFSTYQEQSVVISMVANVTKESLTLMIIHYGKLCDIQ